MKKRKNCATGGQTDPSSLLSVLGPLLGSVNPVLGAAPALMQQYINKQKQDAVVVSATPGNYNLGGPIYPAIQGLNSLVAPIESTGVNIPVNPFLPVNSVFLTREELWRDLRPKLYGKDRYVAKTKVGTGGSSYAKSDNKFRDYADGGDMQLSDNSFQVKGNAGVTDGNYYPEYNANLDHNEVVKDSFVFSDKLKNPKTGKTFAEEAKVLESSIGKSEKKLKINPNDQLAKTTIELNEKRSQALAGVQETLAQLKGLRNGKAGNYAVGGTMNGDPRLMVVSEGDLRTPATYFNPATNQFLTIDSVNGSYKEAPFNSSWLKANLTNIKQHELQNGSTNWNMDYWQQKPLGDVNQSPRLPVDPTSPNTGIQYAGGTWNEDYAINNPGRDANAYRPASPTTPSPTTGNFSTITGGPVSTIPAGESLLPGNAPGNFGGAPYPGASNSGRRPGSGANRPARTPTSFPGSPRNPNYVDPQMDLYVNGNTDKYVPVDPMQPLNMMTRQSLNYPMAGMTLPDGSFVDITELQTPKQYSSLIAPVTSNRNITAPTPNTVSTTMPTAGTVAPVNTGTSNPNKWATGDYLQAAKVLSGFGQLIGGSEVEKPSYDNTRITQNVYDPNQALMQNQRTYKDSMAGFDAPSINTRRAYDNALYANKLGQDDQTIAQYQQMNQQARSQYEQQTANQRRYNVGQTTYTNDVNARNKSAYKEAVDTAFTGLSNFGVGLNQKKQGYDTLNILKTMYPDVYAKIISSIQ